MFVDIKYVRTSKCSNKYCFINVHFCSCFLKGEFYMARNRRNTRGSGNSKNLDSKGIRFLFFTILVFAAIFLFLFVFTKIKNYNFLKDLSKKSNELVSASADSTGSDNSDLKSDSKKSFTLTAIGDIMCHNTQYWDAYNKSTDEYDFSYVFDDIKDYTLSPDITVANLETSFAGKERGYSNYPTFNSPDSLAKAVADIGVDVISTAGNHCLDMGFSGLSRTIDVLDSYGISHLGTYKSEEAQKEILYKTVKGVKIAFIDYTYGTNGIPVPKGKGFCVNLIDKDLIKSQIDKAKSEDADIIVACMHWGTEYRTSANDEQLDLADFLFQNGVDIILGNHPHTLEPMEKRSVTLSDGSSKDCFVIYALGNFICDQNAENTRNSIILNLSLSFDSSDKKLSFDNISYIPIHMYKNPNVSSHKFKLLNIEKSIARFEAGLDTSIGKSKYEDLKVQLQKIKNILGNKF